MTDKQKHNTLGCVLPEHKVRGSWTETETTYLREQFPKMQQKDIANNLGLSRHSVHKKCKKLELKTPSCRKGLNAGFLEGKGKFKETPKEVMQIYQLRSAISRVINKRLKNER